ncbi:ABC transporter substrate-binding protein [Herbaspirillum sp. SJZ099]|uniref:ABC transporter substrate-binding protein n=1 Tax=Herbaspirillum sp. SJZ099 TaxID=2572916 RepID=UPI0011A83D2C|nr:extracellular solute-binding protein [Herbaspirillum sp. SJZ099]TWC71227.1 carbohydrate ABC transporter substrate-binding protein (CUT1 family) [Herbaspirillum sp. SJZ099]
MSKLTRRDFLVSSAAAAAASSVGMNAFAAPAGAAAADSIKYPIEQGATLRILRWKRFVQGDEDLWNANVKKFTELTGVAVRTDSEGWEDVRPKAAVAANVGSGPDIVLGWFDDPQQYPTKLLDMTDLADSLGKRYGGWYDVCRKYGTKDGKWIALPLGVIGNALVYRESQIKAAGFDAIPKDTAGFLKLCQALKAKNTPVGFALGKAVGDANNWAHWLLWSHGGKLVDKKGAVAINSPETKAALEYAKQLYATFVPGTLSWQDPSNNKAYLDGQISMTANGISVYYAAKNSTDPKMQEIGKDTQHAHFPIGPAGKPTELMQITQMMIFKHTKYPNAAKAFVQFMFEPDQYNPWMKASIGYVSQPLKAYEKNPIWTEDPKATVYRDSASLMLDHGHEGPLGQASAACMADYVVVDMVAEAASGSKTIQQAIDRAADRAKRFYKA